MGVSLPADTAEHVRPEPRDRPRILFAMTSSYLPELTGGVESTTHEMCLSLAGRGWTVATLSRSRRLSRFSWRARVNRLLGGAPVSLDGTQGYPSYRSREPLAVIDAVRKQFAPSLAVVQIGRVIPLAQALAGRGIPTLVFLHNLNFAQMGGDFFHHPLVRYVTVSEFMASVLTPKLGFRPDVIPPLIDPQRYAPSSSREVATFINPTPLKGLEFALHLARRRPDVRFEFVEAWPLRRRELRSLMAALADLPNVRLLQRTHDMRPIYGRTRVLLAPSQVEESWGRVATEAQVARVPIIASRIGALPESVGPGGFLVDPHDSPQAWERAFSAVWDDAATYAQLADAAAAYSHRPAIQPSTVLGNFANLAQSHISEALRT